ncbi:MAG: SLC26A/SulP transporter family protein [Candidatus Promineifilaceae bacterium]
METRLSPQAALAARLAPALIAGLVLGLLSVILAISFSALIYTGELSAQLPYLIGLALVGQAVLTPLVTLFSSHVSAFGLSQDAPAASLAVAAAAALSRIPAAASPEARLVSLIALVSLSTLATGLFFLLIARFRLGYLMRYMPFPVIGGFLAGTGWLLALGGVGVMTGLGLEAGLLAPAALAHWLPGLALGALFVLLLRRSQHFLLLPAAVLGATAAFYVVTGLAGVSVEELSANGWLLGPFPERMEWRYPLTPAALGQVEWGAVAGSLGGVAAVMLLSTIGLLLNVSGLELLFKGELDLNRELKAAGIANLAAGLGGGLPGFQSMSLSNLSQRIAGGQRLVAPISSAVCLAALFLGAGLLSLVPRVVMGGLLMFLGLSFLIEWVVQARRRFSRLEYFIILLILAVVALAGLLEAIAVGLAAAVALFVVNYSRVDVIRHALSGAAFRSRMSRGRQARALLAKRGDEIYILQLEGYLFFGTAYRLAEQVRRRLSDASLPPARFVLLDFRRVTGLDSTAAMSFAKLGQQCGERGAGLILTGLTSGLEFSLEAGGASRFLRFPNLDRGLEWSEEQILAASDAIGRDESAGALAALLIEPELAGRLLAFMERRELAAGEYLIRQGDQASDAFLIEAGQLSAQLEQPGAAPMRLESMRAGRVVGELGFYLNVPRTAAVVADRPSVVYRLSQRSLAEMEEGDPEAAAAFHQLMARWLAERTVHLIAVAEALSR